MTGEELLRDRLQRLDASHDFAEAVLTLRDGTRLCFCHRVGERWAKSVGPSLQETRGGSAGDILASIAMFRLNAKHLDIKFNDGSYWEFCFQGAAKDDVPE
jgi:hypothetical protein